MATETKKTMMQIQNPKKILIYFRALLTKSVYMHLEYVGSSLKENMEKKLRRNMKEMH